MLASANDPKRTTCGRTFPYSAGRRAVVLARDGRMQMGYVRHCGDEQMDISGELAVAGVDVPFKRRRFVAYHQFDRNFFLIFLLGSGPIKGIPMRAAI